MEVGPFSIKSPKIHPWSLSRSCVNSTLMETQSRVINSKGSFYSSVDHRDKQIARTDGRREGGRKEGVFPKRGGGDIKWNPSPFLLLLFPQGELRWREREKGIIKVTLVLSFFPSGLSADTHTHTDTRKHNQHINILSGRKIDITSAGDKERRETALTWIICRVAATSVEKAPVRVRRRAHKHVKDF